jgi:hypothetical protein
MGRERRKIDPGLAEAVPPAGNSFLVNKWLLLRNFPSWPGAGKGSHTLPALLSRGHGRYPPVCPQRGCG